MRLYCQDVARSPFTIEKLRPCADTPLHFIFLLEVMFMYASDHPVA